MTAITSERLPDSLISLEIEVEPERVEKSMEKAVRKISQQVKIKGFRPGKAPRRAVEASVGEEQVFATAIDELLPLVVEEAVKEEGINIVGPAEDVDLKSRDPLIIVAKMPITPTVDLGEYEALRAPKQELDVTEEQKTEAILNVQRRFAVLEPVDRSVAWNDFIRGDFRVEIPERENDSGATDEAVDQTEEDTEFPVRENEVALLPGLAEQLIGLNVSEDDQVIEYELNAEDLPEALIGRSAKFTILIKEIKEEILPEVDDEFVISLDEDGIATVSELQASLTKQLQENIDAKIKTDYREEILDLLLATASIEYPKVLVERAIDQMIDRESNHASHTQEGLEQWLESIGQSEEEVRSALHDNATISLRRELVLSELSTVEKIEVDADAVDEQIDAAIESITSGQEGLEAQARQLIDTPDYRRTLASQQVIDNALARLEEICTGESDTLVDDTESSTEKPKASRRGSRRSKEAATDEAVSENTEAS